MLKKEITIISSKEDYDSILNALNVMGEFCKLQYDCCECPLYDKSGKCNRIPMIRGLNSIKNELYVEE